MSYRIEKRQVYENLINFKNQLDESYDEEKGENGQDREYQAILNKKTGEMRFSTLIHDSEEELSQLEKKGWKKEDWKKISVLASPKKQTYKIVDENKKEIPSNELTPIADKVTKETEIVLNKKKRSLEDLPLYS